MQLESDRIKDCIRLCYISCNMIAGQVRTDTLKKIILHLFLYWANFVHVVMIGIFHRVFHYLFIVVKFSVFFTNIWPVAHSFGLILPVYTNGDFSDLYDFSEIINLNLINLTV